MDIDQQIQEVLLKINKLERRRTTIEAEWVQAESVDGDLSIIKSSDINEITGTDQLRFIPKLASVSPVAGDTVICLRDPCVIIGVLKGDINLAED